jgi:hypothetical protein
MADKTFLMNKWILVAMVVLCWALSASFMAMYYYYEYGDLSSKMKGVIITANLGIDYGNGTRRWFNETRITAGSTLLNLTELVTSVNYSEGSLGAYVNSIDGASNSSKYWFWWTYSSSTWVLGPVGFDKYVVGDNETLFWYLEDSSTWPPSSP